LPIIYFSFGFLRGSKHPSQDFVFKSPEYTAFHFNNATQFNPPCALIKLSNFYSKFTPKQEIDQYTYAYDVELQLRSLQIVITFIIRKLVNTNRNINIIFLSVDCGEFH
jgi:hypothetical protein